MPNVEIPSWAWGLIVAILFAGPALVARVAGYWFARLEARLDEFPRELRAVEARLDDRASKVETRVTVLETRASDARAPQGTGRNGV